MASNGEIPVLILSGTVGVGKSTVLVEIHDILMTARIPHACIERDALAYSWPTRGEFNRATVIENVAAICANSRRAGAERLVIAGVVETTADVEAFGQAIPGARVTVCRLVAPEAERLARLNAREVCGGSCGTCVAQSNSSWYSMPPSNVVDSPIVNSPYAGGGDDSVRAA